MTFPITIENLKSQHTTLSNLESYSQKPASLQVPVNLNIFESYYKSFDQLRYTDEYEFTDKLLVLDSKNFSSYKDSNGWLNGLKSSGKRNFLKNDNSVSLPEYIDWTENGKHLKLKDILNLDVSDTRIFTPLEKRVYLKYDYQHEPNIKIYSHYFSPDSHLKNDYLSSSYGKLKPFPITSEKLFPYTSPEDRTCNKLREKDSSLGFILNRSFEEGYEGICDRITMFGRHYAFPLETTRKWITPYVAYRYYEYKYYDIQYHYYSLGEFADSAGNSINLMKDSNKSLRFIDYSDIFKLTFESSNLHVGLNLQKLPTDISEFLKISSALKFRINIRINEKDTYKDFKFSDVLDSKVTIPLSNSNYVFSNARISVESGDDRVFMTKLTDYVYSVDTSDLERQGYKYQSIMFDEKDSGKYMPSQLLNKSILSSFFYFSSNHNRRIRLTEKDLEDLNVYVNYDDSEGTAVIVYELFNKKHEVYLDGMKKIPSFFNANLEALDLNDAKAQLKKRFPTLNDYFWENISLVPEDSHAHFDDKVKHKIISIHNNTRVSDQWKLDDVRISILNRKSIAPILTFNPNYSKISDLFELNDYAKELKLNKSDYNFSLVSKDDNKLRFLASFASDKSYFGEKIYEVLLNDHQHSSFPDTDSLFSPMETIVWTVGSGIFIGSSALAIYPKLAAGKKFFKI